MPKQDDDQDPFIIKVQKAHELDRIRAFVDETGHIGRTLIVEAEQPVFSAEEKEKWLAVFTDPAGITLHTFPDRDGKWRARVTCADGSQLYSESFNTAHGVFTWFAETSMLFRMFYRPYAKQGDE